MSVENEEMSKEMMDQYNAAFADAAGGVDQGDAPVAEEAATPEEAQEQPAQEPVEAAAEATETAQEPAQADEKPAVAAGDDDQKIEAEKTEPTDEEKADAALELQRLKSWEGRLKKQAAEQKAREDAMAAAEAARLSASTTATDETPSNTAEQSVADVANQVADGTLTPAQAMQQVSADFGEDFVKMIQVMVAAQAAEASGKVIAEVKGKVDGIAQHIASDAELKHFERIETAHPDFNQIRVSPEFAAFVEQADSDLQRIANGGTAKEVIQLLKTYKTAQQAAAKKATPPAEPDGVDAAAGVRSSGGMKLPAETTGSDNYADAFAEAAASAAKRN